MSRNFNVKQDALGNTDGNILFIFPDWYFGALIFSVVNAAAKRPSKFAFDRSQNSLLSDEELLLLLDDIELIILSTTHVFLKQK